MISFTKLGLYRKLRNNYSRMKKTNLAIISLVILLTASCFANVILGITNIG